MKLRLKLIHLTNNAKVNQWPRAIWWNEFSWPFPIYCWKFVSDCSHTFKSYLDPETREISLFKGREFVTFRYPWVWHSQHYEIIDKFIKYPNQMDFFLKLRWRCFTRCYLSETFMEWKVFVKILFFIYFQWFIKISFKLFNWCEFCWTTLWV